MPMFFNHTYVNRYSMIFFSLDTFIISIIIIQATYHVTQKIYLEEQINPTYKLLPITLKYNNFISLLIELIQTSGV